MSIDLDAIRQEAEARQREIMGAPDRANEGERWSYYRKRLANDLLPSRDDYEAFNRHLDGWAAFMAHQQTVLAESAAEVSRQAEEIKRGQVALASTARQVQAAIAERNEAQAEVERLREQCEKMAAEWDRKASEPFWDDGLQHTTYERNRVLRECAASLRALREA